LLGLCSRTETYEASSDSAGRLLPALVVPGLAGGAKSLLWKSWRCQGSVMHSEVWRRMSIHRLLPLLGTRVDGLMAGLDLRGLFQPMIP